jgi:hypothetical protein
MSIEVPNNMFEPIDKKFKLLAYNPFTGNSYTQHNALLLCAKDAAVPAALKAYIQACKELNAKEGHIESLEAMLKRVELFQEEVECRIPDTVGKELEHCLK